MISALSLLLSQIPNVPLATLALPSPMGYIMEGESNWKQTVDCIKHIIIQLPLTLGGALELKFY